MATPRRALVLSGFMGTGKSTVGPRVASRAGARFVDLDEAVEARAGLSIAQLVDERGWEAFRALEAAALDEVLGGPDPVVVSVGGGALGVRSRRHAVLRQARVVTLTASPEAVASRLAAEPAGAQARPLLRGFADLTARIRELWAEREDAYAECHATVATEGRTPEAVADDAVAAWRDDSLVVPLGRASYPVRFVDDLGAAAAAELVRLSPTGAFVLTDDGVARHWLAPLARELEASGHPALPVVESAAGEADKTLSSVEVAARRLVALGADRGAVLLALGGGVVSDRAGFVAATLHRGVRWIAAPTTLLAMADAAVGGKTGVDLDVGKNLLGAIHQPQAVLVRPAHVRTEDARAYRSAWAEILKAGLLADPDLVEALATGPKPWAARDERWVEAQLRRALRVKIDLVARDEREQGERALLNLGHTVGHAIESTEGWGHRTHGEAVSLGLVAVAELGAHLGLTPPEVVRRVREVLELLSLPTDWRAVDRAGVAARIRLDKKRRGDAVRLIVLRDVGRPQQVSVPVSHVAEFCLNA